jgi:serine/threonine-protein kinase SRPK3
LQEIVDDRIIDAFAKAELETPSPRKFVKGTPVYRSRQFELPTEFGGAVLNDFGAAIRGD